MDSHMNSRCLFNHWRIILFLFLLALVLCIWVYVSISKCISPVFYVTVFQCVQLFSTFIIGCWISHVISSSYNRALKRLAIYCESIERLLRIIQDNRDRLVSYSSDVNEQKDSEKSKGILSFFSNISAELSFLRENLKNDEFSYSKDLFEGNDSLPNLLATTKTIITEMALCNEKKRSKSYNHNDMELAAEKFINQFQTKLGQLKLQLHQ